MDSNLSDGSLVQFAYKTRGDKKFVKYFLDIEDDQESESKRQLMSQDLNAIQEVER